MHQLVRICVRVWPYVLVQMRVCITLGHLQVEAPVLGLLRGCVLMYIGVVRRCGICFVLVCMAWAHRTALVRVSVQVFVRVRVMSVSYSSKRRFAE